MNFYQPIKQDRSHFFSDLFLKWECIEGAVIYLWEYHMLEDFFLIDLYSLRVLFHWRITRARLSANSINQDFPIKTCIPCPRSGNLSLIGLIYLTAYDSVHRSLLKRNILLRRTRRVAINGFFSPQVKGKCWLNSTMSW